MDGVASLPKVPSFSFYLFSIKQWAWCKLDKLVGSESIVGCDRKYGFSSISFQDKFIANLEIVVIHVKITKTHPQGSDPRAATCRGKLQSKRSKLNMEINKELMLRSGAENLFK